jgi:hypothetical protein
VSETFVGYDPGGNRAHGLAELQVADGKPISIISRTLRSAEEVIAGLEVLASVSALGVDTLSCWSTGGGGWRPADRWLREQKQYEKVRNSVTTPNGLFGSMSLNGMAVLVESRRKFPNVMITETHPKVLYFALSGKTHDYKSRKSEMDAFLSDKLGIPRSHFTIGDEHQWDAALSALAAHAGLRGLWRRDLHELAPVKGERLVRPCGATHYYWPE